MHPLSEFTLTQLGGILFLVNTFYVLPLLLLLLLLFRCCTQNSGEEIRGGGEEELPDYFLQILIKLAGCAQLCNILNIGSIIINRYTECVTD